MAAAQPQTILTIPARHRIVEGIASDGRTIWVSSLLDRQVLACTRRCRPLATLPRGLHPFAIAWDRPRQRLWVAADCPPKVPGIKECDQGALIALDRTGRIRARIAPPANKYHPGDVSVSGTGVFVSDSQNGAVYQLAKGRLRPVIGPGVGKSGQGTALEADGKRLVVADYSQGIAVVDLASGKRTLLPRPGDKPLRGIDGLVRCRSTYYGIYNGTSPGTLVAISVQPNSIAIEEPLPDGTLPDPTQVAYDGKRLLIVADSGWATADKPAFVRKIGAPIVAVPLSPDCKPL